MAFTHTRAPLPNVSTPRLFLFNVFFFFSRPVFFFNFCFPRPTLRSKVSFEKVLKLKEQHLGGDLLLKLLDVGQQLLAARLEQQVAVHEPRRVAEADELEQLGQQRHGVDCADDGRGEPEEHDGAARVEEGRGLVLDGVPLEVEGRGESVSQEEGDEGKKLEEEKKKERPRGLENFSFSSLLPSAGCP